MCIPSLNNFDVGDKCFEISVRELNVKGEKTEMRNGFLLRFLIFLLN